MRSRDNEVMGEIYAKNNCWMLVLIETYRTLGTDDGGLPHMAYPGLMHNFTYRIDRNRLSSKYEDCQISNQLCAAK
jgi:hypothetical protein